MEFPYFSIVIPTYKRATELSRCLRAIAELDYPKTCFEVIVVDDGGGLIEDAAKEFKTKIELKLLQQTNSGPATARNNGALAAHGEFLAFTDDDCAPRPDWLKSFAVQFARTPRAALGGQTLNALTDNLFSGASQLLTDYLYHYFNGRADSAGFFTSNNFALSRAGFLALNGFDQSFPLAAGEDREFCERWKNAGRELVYVSEAIVEHHHRLRGNEFWRQHFNYGRGAFHFRAVTAARAKKPIYFEQTNFYLRLLWFPFWQQRFIRAAMISGLFGVAQVATVCGFLVERARQKNNRQKPADYGFI